MFPALSCLEPLHFPILPLLDDPLQSFPLPTGLGVGIYTQLLMLMQLLRVQTLVTKSLLILFYACN